MEWWHVYLFTRLDNISCLVTIVSLVLGIMLVMGFIFSPMILDINRDWKPTLVSTAKITLAVFIVALFLSMAVPTQKEAAAIYLLPKLANSDFTKEAQQIPTDVAKLMRLKLESWIADMEPAKMEKK